MSSDMDCNNKNRWTIGQVAAAGAFVAVATVGLVFAGLEIRKRRRGRRRRRRGKSGQTEISLEELQALNKNPANEKVLKRLEQQDAGQLVQLQLLCSFYGLAESFQKITKLSKAGKRSKIIEDCLLVAARTGSTEIVQLLIMEFPVDVNCINSHGNNALILASLRGHIDIVKILVSSAKELKVNKINRLRATALEYACERGDEAIVTELLKRSDLDPSINDNKAVHKAALRNHGSIVLSLLSNRRVAILPSPSNQYESELIAFLQQAAVETARICSGILTSNWLSPLPLHLRAYILALAMSNSVILVGNGRGDIWKVSSLILKNT